MPIFWQTFKYLERINLKVVETNADATPQKNNFFTVHQHLVGGSDTKIVCLTKNIYLSRKQDLLIFWQMYLI